MTRTAHRQGASSASRTTRRKGPKLGVQKRQRVVTAGGKVGQWFTPRWCADLFARWARIGPDMRAGEAITVLDAGAGEGALTIAALRRGAARVTALELDPKWAEFLRRLPLPELRTTVVEGDFLAGTDPRQVVIDVGYSHDVVISNPVWEGKVPELFMLRGVELAPRVCLILPVNVLSGTKRAKLFRTALRPTRAHILDRRPIFRGMTGGMRDVCFLEVTKRTVPLPDHVPCTFPITVGSVIA